MFSTLLTPRHQLGVLATVIACIVVSGCALFKRPVAEEHDVSQPEPITREAIALEIAVGGHPGDDSLLRLIWSELDEMGVLKAEDRHQLNENGFRVGAGSSPPSPLQTMLREGAKSKRRSDRPTWNNKPGQLPGSSSITLFHGQETLVEASQIIPEFHFEISADDSESSGGKLEFKNAKCVFRVTAEKVQDGWIKLRFLPEIHHGAVSARPVMTETSIQIRDQQRVQPLYDLQFEVTLYPGEVAIVGATETEKQRPGYQFFNAGKSTGDANRLVAVRFLSIGRIEGERDAAAIIRK